MTVMQLGGAILWGVFAVLPMALSYTGGNDEPIDAAFWLIFATLFQVIFGVACYTAGGVR